MFAIFRCLHFFFANAKTIQDILNWLCNTEASSAHYLQRWGLFSDLCVKIARAAGFVIFNIYWCTRTEKFDTFVTILCYVISSTPDLSCGLLVLLSRPHFYQSLTKDTFTHLILTGGDPVTIVLLLCSNPHSCLRTSWRFCPVLVCGLWREAPRLGSTALSIL